MLLSYFDNLAAFAGRKEGKSSRELFGARVIFFEVGHDLLYLRLSFSMLMYVDFREFGMIT